MIHGKLGRPFASAGAVSLMWKILVLYCRSLPVWFGKDKSAAAAIIFNAPKTTNWAQPFTNQSTR